MGKGHVKGFTLVELVIVIVIIGILSVVAVPMYRGYTRRTMASEGKALLATISASEQAYLAQNGQCLTVNPAVSFNPELDVDARSNKYYRTFSITGCGAMASPATPMFVATVYGSGDAAGMNITLTQPFDQPPQITEPAY